MTGNRNRPVYILNKPNGERDGQTIPHNIDVEVAFLFRRRMDDTYGRMDSAQHGLSVMMPEAPTQVVIDPEMKLLHSLEFDPGLDMSIRSVHSAPTVNGRIHAAETLAQGAARRGLDAIHESFKAQSHWGVRVAFARALGTSKSVQAGTILAELLLWEKDPRVMQTLASQCGHFRSPEVEDALVAWLDGPSTTHWARGTALRSLGGQRGEQHFDRLVNEGTSSAVGMGST